VAAPSPTSSTSHCIRRIPLTRPATPPAVPLRSRFELPGLAASYRYIWSKFGHAILGHTTSIGASGRGLNSGLGPPLLRCLRNLTSYPTPGQWNLPSPVYEKSTRRRLMPNDGRANAFFVLEYGLQIRFDGLHIFESDDLLSKYPAAIV
jgi:hypothetical protein